MSDPNRFDLDERQRAMLAEMGVRVGWPQRSGVALPVLADGAPSAKKTPMPVLTEGVFNTSGAASSMGSAAPVAAASSVRLAKRDLAHPLPVLANERANAPVFLPLPEGLSSMDWTALQTTVKSCQSCAMCTKRQPPLLGTSQGAEQGTARWMVVGDLPSEADAQQGQPFTGPEGELLDNMLKAVGVRRQGLLGTVGANTCPAEAILTHAVKCRPLDGRNPDVAELAVCAGYLSRQVALAQPKVILAMGRFAIQTLLGTTEPMGKLRGTVHQFEGVPVVVTYPPSSLLRNQSDKAKAWADLVMAMSLAKA